MITSYNFKKKFIISFSVIISVLAILGLIYFVKETEFPIKYKEEIFTASKNNGISAELIYAVIKAESNFNKDAVSSKGAIGLMQVKPSTAKYVAELRGEKKEYDLTDEKENIDVGSYYLSYLIKQFIDKDTALLAYNAGEGKVKMWLKDKKYSEDGITVNNVPYKESREYVDKVNKNLERYKEILQKYC